VKISDMTNDQATEALLRLSEPFANLCNDEETLQTLENLAGMRNMPTIKVIGAMFPKFASIALKNHRADVYEIIAALQMIPAAKVGKMNFKETVQMLRESYDDILRDFFTQSVAVAKISGKE